MCGLLGRLRDDDNGATAIISALLLTMVLAFVGLGLHTASGVRQQRDLQQAADNAATGAMLALRRDSAADVTLAARALLHANGAVGPETGVTILPGEEVHVALSAPARSPFAGLWGSDARPVAARASATLVPVGNACVLALDPPPTMPLRIDRQSDLQLGDCVVLPADAHMSAIRTADANPWQDQAWPLTGGCHFSHLLVDTDMVLTPAQGPVVLCDLRVIPGGRLMLAPGVYYLRSGVLTVEDGGEMAGDGVTIILGPGTSMEIAPGARVALSAARGGFSAGLVVAGTPHTFGRSYLTGGAGLHLEGSVYLPAQELVFTGSGDCLHLIAARIHIAGPTRTGNACAHTAVRPIIDRVARLTQ